MDNKFHVKLEELAMVVLKKEVLKCDDIDDAYHTLDIIAAENFIDFDKNDLYDFVCEILSK